MEITVDNQYEQLLAMIRKLPAAKIKQLKSTLDDLLIEAKAVEELSTFQMFLLRGPVMTDVEYRNYQKNRRLFRFNHCF